MKLNQAVCFVVIVVCLFICIVHAAEVNDNASKVAPNFYHHFMQKRSLSSCSTTAQCTTTQSILCTKNSDCCCNPANGNEECVLHVAGHCLYVESHPALTTGTCQVAVGC